MTIRPTCLMLLFAVVMGVCAPLAAQAGNRPTPKSAPDPLDNPDALFASAARITRKDAPTYKRNVIEAEVLFDGENLKPYELPYDGRVDREFPYVLKQTALLGTFSWESRASYLIGKNNGESMSGFGAYSRLRYGPPGVDFAYWSFSDTGDLKTLMNARATLDLDLYPWLIFRPTFGISVADFETTEGSDDDSGTASGAEIEIFPLRPFTVEAHMQGYHYKMYSTVRDAFIGVGFVPTLLPRIMRDTYPSLLPEVRVGYRWITGQADTTGINGIVIEAALEF